LVFGYLVGRVLIVLLFLPGYFAANFYGVRVNRKALRPRMRAAASTFLVTRAVAEGEVSNAGYQRGARNVRATAVVIVIVTIFIRSKAV
jgi:hypothetical protein